MLIPLQIPPGVFKNGTELQSAGRWSASNLVRWIDGTVRPVGGWRAKSSNTVSGAARSLFSWKDNSANPWLSIGTHSGLYVMSVGNIIKDITPTGFTVGGIDASAFLGYGGFVYGSDQYGIERPASSTVLPASVWSFDSWGEYLVGCCNTDGKIYEWQLGFETPTISAVVANAPVSNKAVVVTAERIMMALGAGGNPRKLAWSDQEDNTTWTPTTLNQAGDFELTTTGTLIAAKRVRGVTLIWTDLDVHTATYIGQPLIYGFEKVGTGCGLVSPNAAAVVGDNSAFWISRTGFWMYDGYVKPLPSDVSDYVFSNMNRDQISKIYAFSNTEFGEVWWGYPSEGSTEIDSYVIYNYHENHWSLGTMSRTAGVQRGVFDRPMMMGTDGYVYEHEIGFNHGGAEVFLESGPVQLGVGDNTMFVRELIPDESQQGDTRISFSTKFYPNAAEYDFGPYSMANPTSVRFSGRQVKMRIEQVQSTDWRVGTVRVDAVAAGRR